MEEPMSTPGATPDPRAGAQPDPTLAYEPPSHTSPFPTSVPSTSVPSAAVPPATPGYAPPVAYGAPAGRMPRNEEITWGVAAHLSGFVAAYIALGFLGPLVVLLTGGRRSEFVRRHAIEALNFNLTVLLALAVSAVLILLVVGLVLIPLIGVAYLVFTIMGAVTAGRGDDFRYPMTIRFVH